MKLAYADYTSEQLAADPLVIATYFGKHRIQEVARMLNPFLPKPAPGPAAAKANQADDESDLSECEP